MFIFKPIFCRAAMYILFILCIPLKAENAPDPGHKYNISIVKRTTRFSASRLAREENEAGLLTVATENKKSKPVNWSAGWFSYDKGYHFLGSFMITVAGGKSFQKFAGAEDRSSKIWAASLSFSVGLGKEIYDSIQPKNHFSYKDLAADVAGIIAGLVVLNNE